MTIKNNTIEDIVSFLKTFFYFDCEKKLKEILNREESNSKGLIHISIRPSDYKNPKSSYGKEKPIVTDLHREVWDRDENDGYWLALKLDY